MRTDVLVMCDLIADLSVRIPSFPIEAQNLQEVTYLEVGPGGATNVAIMAARFGLSVACLGEVGDDHFGRAVLDGLKRENVGVSGVVVTKRARTPVAGVIVDDAAEPAYLGFAGSLQIGELSSAWRRRIGGARALFADGWAEHAGVARIIEQAFRAASLLGIPTFFDPGPGNPRVDNAWHTTVADLATVLLANEEEARRLTGQAGAHDAARAFVARGVHLAVVKRGAKGCVLAGDRDSHVVAVPAFPVEALDATGAGDSLTGAILYGYLNGLSLEALGILGNATGAAKICKLGTGHNMPTLDEVRSVLRRFGVDDTGLVPAAGRSHEG